ncbi:MAG: hypothetical protein O2807_08460 [bacterium]|nr:hypothetical protein [bacterium]
MAEAVVPMAENAVAGPRLRFLDKKRTQLSIECLPGLGDIREEKREVQNFQLRHPRCEIACRKVAHAQQAAFDHGEQVLRLVAEVEDVPEVIDFDALPETRPHRLPEAQRGPAVGSMWGRITCETNLDRAGHFPSFSSVKSE